MDTHGTPAPLVWPADTASAYEWARFYVQAFGMAVFPSSRNKVPLIPNWPKKASRNPVILEYWRRKYPNANWSVACGKSNVAMLDIDMKDGKDGKTALSGLELDHGFLPDTLEAVSPSGKGRHLVFLAPASGNIKTSTNALALGVDTRGTGGQFLIPGSVYKGKRYRCVNRISPAVLPESWGTVCRSIGREAVDQTPLVELDQEHHIRRAINWLTNHAPLAIKGTGRGYTTVTRVAPKLKDLGISEETAWELMLEHWADRCVPPWEAEELRERVRRGYLYCRNSAPGSAVDYDEMFADAPEGIQDAPGKPVKAEELKAQTEDEDAWVPYSDFERLLTAGKDKLPLAESAAGIDIGGIPERDWVVPGRFITGYLTTTVAPGGGSKSTLSGIEAVAVATGRELAGFPIRKPGPVWIYNAEDPTDEMQRKLAAVCIQHGIDIKSLDNVYFRSGQSRAPFIFVEVRDRQLYVNRRVVEEVRAFINEKGIRLFILDPFIRTHRVSENDNSNADAVAFVLSKIGVLTGCAIHIVHHTRKGAEGGDMDAARGASAIMSAARVGHSLMVASKEDAKAYGVPEEERRFYVRLDDTKSNFTSPTDQTRWFKRGAVRLPNGEAIGVLEPIKLEKRSSVEKQSGVAELQRVIADAMRQPGEMSAYRLAALALEDPAFQFAAPKPRSGSSEHISHRQVERMIYALPEFEIEGMTYKYQEIQHGAQTRHTVFASEVRKDANPQTRSGS